jgi:hypothetical protein
MEPNKEKDIPPSLESLSLDDIVVITKNSKIVHKVFMKLKTLILSTTRTLDQGQVSLILTRVMYELNKESLYGFQKRSIAISIMVLLLDAVGTPDTASRVTAEIIAELVEMIYAASLHRYKKKKDNKCIVM